MLECELDCGLDRQQFKNLQKNEDLLIIDVLEVEKLWPLNEFESKTIYNLHEILLNHAGKIYYLSSDLNFFERYKKWLLYKDLLYSDLKENIIAYVFPYSQRKWTDEQLSVIESITSISSDKPKSKNFINLTCGPKLLRLLLLDKYYHHEYFEYSYFPWHHGTKNDFDTYSVFEPIEWHEGQKIKINKKETSKICWTNPIDMCFLHDSAPFKELTESKKFIDFFSFRDSYETFNTLLPVEVFTTNCDIVTESYLNYDSVHFTEKTYKEFIYKRPFLLFGAKNQNMIMKKLGYELYDEVFDYEFDTYDTVEQRFNAYCKQINRFIDMKPEKFRNILTCLNDKIEHNFNHFMREYEESKKIDKLISSTYDGKRLNNLFENSKPLLAEYEKRLND